jgi:hypothetical protein
MLAPAAYARLAAVAVAEGRTRANMVQVIVLNAIGLATVPIPSLERARQARDAREARERDRALAGRPA